MFQISGKTIKITRGDTGLFTLNIMSDGQPYDYSGDTVLFTVKKSVNTAEVLFQKTIEYGQTVVVEPECTASLPYGKFVYDVQVTTAQGIVNTVITPHPFIVAPEVTWTGVE